MTDTPAAAGTPRTDGAMRQMACFADNPGVECLSMLARTLERELSACRAELAAFKENTEGVLVAWKRDYDGEKERGDRWMADALESERRLLASESECMETFNLAAEQQKRAEESERLLAAATKDLAAEKGNADMIANAWQRELCEQGIGYRPKAHWIDYMVLATRQVMALAKENGVRCCGNPDLCANMNCNTLLRYRLSPQHQDYSASLGAPK